MERNIRYAIAADLPNIVEIYNASIPGRMATADLEPVSVESRLDWFHAHSKDKYPIWVMEIDGAIAGWLSLQKFYGRLAYSQTAEISVYVSSNYQRAGIGYDLLSSMLQECPRLAIFNLLGFIFAHNQPSLNLFAKFNFQQWGYLPQVAELDREKRDLVIMGLSINLSSREHVRYPEP